MAIQTLLSMKCFFSLPTDIPTNSTEGAIKELRSKRSMSRTEVMLYAHSIALKMKIKATFWLIWN